MPDPCRIFQRGAGGSANAAAALVACSTLWGIDVSPDDRAALGAELGADVPFSLHGMTALGTGRGDELVELARTNLLR